MTKRITNYHKMIRLISFFFFQAVEQGRHPPGDMGQKTPVPMLDLLHQGDGWMLATI